MLHTFLLLLLYLVEHWNRLKYRDTEQNRTKWTECQSNGIDGIGYNQHSL